MCQDSINFLFSVPFSSSFIFPLFASEENVSDIQRVKEREKCKCKLQRTSYASPGLLHRRAPGPSMLGNDWGMTGPWPIDSLDRDLMWPLILKLAMDRT